MASLSEPGDDARVSSPQLRRRLLRPDLLAAGYESAAADFAADKTALAKKRIGPPNGADCDAEVEGEVALRWQFRARRQQAFADVGLGSIGEPEIERTGSSREVGKPTCHRDNFYIAS